MQLFDLTLSTPAENLALDEALLDVSEASESPLEALRIWEPNEPFVVLGRSSQAAREVDLAACAARGIKVLRRASGGAAVMAAPGSLMYAVVLSYESRPALRSLDEAHCFVMQTMRRALELFLPGVSHQGTCDLTLGARKFSGNSVRCKQRSFLYHGTLLHGMDLALVENLLQMPPRQPDYRANRPHESFVTNIPVNVGQLRQALIATWQAQPSDRAWPRERVAQLVAERYGRDDWTWQR